MEFNKKYDLDIPDLNITKLELIKGTNESLEDLCDIEFHKLKELNILQSSYSLDLKIFRKAKFEKLEKLILGGIKDISDFRKCKI